MTAWELAELLIKGPHFDVRFVCKGHEYAPWIYEEIQIEISAGRVLIKGEDEKG